METMNMHMGTGLDGLQLVLLIILNNKIHPYHHLVQIQIAQA